MLDELGEKYLLKQSGDVPLRIIHWLNNSFVVGSEVVAAQVEQSRLKSFVEGEITPNIFPEHKEKNFTQVFS